MVTRPTAGRTRRPSDTAGQNPTRRLNDARLNGATLAANVADRIVRDIVQLGWPEGAVLGSEPDLLERYGVSRAVFREAVRLVEHQHVARMRRGPGGGLVVTAPSFDSVIDAAMIYLIHVGATIAEVFEARLVLEGLAAELAPARMTEADVDALRALAERERVGEAKDPRELHALLASMSDNPALEFFVDLLNRVAGLYLDDPKRISGETFTASARAHGAIVRAVLSGDAGLARHRMTRHLEAEADYLRASSRTRIGVPRPSADAKRGSVLASEILADVARRGWKVGELVGSEGELMARYGVSRAVLREAVRVLEYHQVARMRRGPGGGLFVAEPGVGATTEAVALYLDRLSITPSQLFEVRAAVEMAIVDVVLVRLDEHGRERIEQALEIERSASIEEFRDIGHDLHAVLASIAGNRVLELLAGVLLRLTRIHQAPPPGTTLGDTPIGDVTRVHELLVGALVDGDRELARLRMRKHLKALSRWVR